MVQPNIFRISLLIRSSLNYSRLRVTELMATLLLSPSGLVAIYKVFYIYHFCDKSFLIQFGEGWNGMAKKIFIKENVEENFMLHYWGKLTYLKDVMYEIKSQLWNLRYLGLCIIFKNISEMCLVYDM
jgi:hypothetical protein